MCHTTVFPRNIGQQARLLFGIIMQTTSESRHFDSLWIFPSNYARCFGFIQTRLASFLCLSVVRVVFMASFLTTVGILHYTVSNITMVSE
jgi:hypothetical protein